MDLCEKLRRAVRRDRRPAARIARDAGIDRASLCRFANGGAALSAQTSSASPAVLGSAWPLCNGVRDDQAR